MSGLYLERWRVSLRHYRLITGSIAVSLGPAAFSPQRSVVFVHLTQQVQPRAWLWPFKSAFPWEMVVQLSLVERPQGRWIIAHQHDYIPPDSLMNSFPLLGWLWGGLGRRAVALGISGSVFWGSVAWKAAARAYDAAFAAIGADSVPPPNIQNGRQYFSPQHEVCRDSHFFSSF